MPQAPDPNAPPAVDRWLAALAAQSLRRPWSMVAVGMALFALAAIPAFRLYANLHTDLRELLPQGAPAAVALDALEQRVGGFSHLSIVIETGDLQAGQRFVDALGTGLKVLVPEVVRDVRYRNDDERAFLDAHGALYASEPDLRKLRDGLRAAIARAKERANPFLVDLEEPSPIVDKELRATLDRLRASARREDRFVDGYLSGEEGRTLVVIVTPSDPAISLEGSQRLFHAVDRIVRGLHPTTFHPSIRVGYDGEVRELIEAQEHLVNDLEFSSVLVLFAVGAAILLYYRSLRALPLLVLPLLLGVVLTFAVSRQVIGYLNPNTAFLGGIIIGNGINAGIIVLARYLEERRGGALLPEALSTAMTGSWRATLTASAAAAASYASLGATGFRGFNQFAFMGAAGMVLTWLTTYLFMPALLVIAERVKPLVGRSPREGAGGSVSERFARWVSRQWRPVIAASVVASLVSAVLIVRYSRDPIEYNFGRLGSRQGQVDGAAYWGKRLEAVMRSYVTPTVVLVETPGGAAAVAAALRARKQADGPSSPIDTVATFADLLPTDQPRKLALLREILELFDDQMLDALEGDERTFAARLRKTTVLREVTLSDAPARWTRLFREKGGAEGRLVLVYPTLAATAEHGRVQLAFARSVRAAAEKADPGAYVAGSLILGADIVESIIRDGGTAATLSFLAVAILTIVVLGSLRNAFWVVGSLAVGALWMGGLLGALDLKLNFVNFVVLPITFGIGVDYAVNLYQRYRQGDGEGLVRAVSASGGAVVLCSATTMIGYAVLLVADNQAIYSFGLTAVLGEMTCLSAAVVLLPAALVAARRWRGAP